jgi:triacylglycerol lipase
MMNRSNTGLRVTLLLIVQIAVLSPPPAVAAEAMTVAQFQTQALAYAPECHRTVPAFAFQLTAEFSPQQAYLMLLAAFLSHADAARIEQQLARWGFGHYRLFGRDSLGAYGYAAEHERFALIAFRGTETVLGGQRNTELLLQPADSLGISGNVHSGYQALIGSFHDAILTTLAASADAAKPIFLTGHSLGGALALIEAMALDHANYPIAAVYGFGHPRVGDERFRRAVEQRLSGRYYRIDTPRDVAPHVPPTQASAQAFAQLLADGLPLLQPLLADSLFRLGYASHAGQGYWLSGDGRVIAHGADDSNREIAFWRSAIGNNGGIDLLQADWLSFINERFTSHTPAFYICRLAQALASSHYQ